MNSENSTLNFAEKIELLRKINEQLINKDIDYQGLSKYDQIFLKYISEGELAISKIWLFEKNIVKQLPYNQMVTNIKRINGSIELRILYLVFSNNYNNDILDSNFIQKLKEKSKSKKE